MHSEYKALSVVDNNEWVYYYISTSDLKYSYIGVCMNVYQSIITVLLLTGTAHIHTCVYWYTWMYVHVRYFIQYNTIQYNIITPMG